MGARGTGLSRQTQRILQLLRAVTPLVIIPLVGKAAQNKGESADAHLTSTASGNDADGANAAMIRHVRDLQMWCTGTVIVKA